MRLKEQFRNIPIYQPGKSLDEVKREFGLKEVIKLASNENPFGSSKLIREKLLREMEFLPQYPDGSGQNLKQKIAEHHGVDTNQIILGNGSDEVIHYLSRVYLNHNTEVIMPTPTFPMYKANALMEEARIIEIPLEDGRHDLDKMAAAVTDATAMIWVCNPNNPTGTFVSEEELESFLHKVPSNVLVLVDEAYAEYVTAERYPDTFKLMKKYKNLMILRTFSKIYGLAALRIGYGIGSEEIINDLLRVKDPFNTNHLAQASAEAAFSDQEFVEYCRNQNYKSMSYLTAGLDELGFKYFPSQTNFLLVFHQLNDDKVNQKFLEEGIIIRPGNKLGLPGTVRVTIGTIEQMERVLKVFKQLV